MLSSRGTRAYIVNSTFPDEPQRGSLRVISTRGYGLGALVRTGIEPVGVTVGQRGTVYVANYGSKSVSAIRVRRLIRLALADRWADPPCSTQEGTMGIFTRGFSGRRSADDDRLPPGQYLTGDFPVLSAGADPTRPARRLDVHGPHRDGDQRHAWTWAELMALPVEERHGRHPLRHAAGASSTPRGAGSRSTRCSRTSRPRPTSRWCTATAATRRTCRSRTCSTARPGSPSSTTATSSRPSTAARPGCWSRTCTSGSRRSGCAASS